MRGFINIEVRLEDGKPVVRGVVNVGAISTGQECQDLISMLAVFEGALTALAEDVAPGPEDTKA